MRVQVCVGAWVAGLHVTTSCLLFSVKTFDHEVQDKLAHQIQQTSAPNKATHASQ